MYRRANETFYELIFFGLPEFISLFSFAYRPVLITLGTLAHFGHFRHFSHVKYGAHCSAVSLM